MARTFTNLRTLEVNFLKPRRFSLVVAGASIDGGRNMLNQSISMDVAGGGFLTLDYEECFVQAREQHEYVNWLGAELDGSFRFINVPIMTEWAGPFPVFDRFPAAFVDHIPHSDGSYFSDGSGYSQATVWGSFTANAALFAGQISLRVYGASRPLRWSDWFSIYHPVKGWRAYRYRRVESVSDEGVEVVSGASVVYRDYVLALQIPLREAVASGTRVEFARPRFVAKIAPGQSVRWSVESFWVSRPTLQFVEAF